MYIVFVPSNHLYNYCNPLSPFLSYFNADLSTSSGPGPPEAAWAPLTWTGTTDSPASELLEGLRAAAARRAIMGEMRPLLWEIFSMMEEVEKEAGVEAVAPSAPVVELKESEGRDSVPEDAAEIMAAGGGGCSGSRGISGKKEPEAARPEPDRARATGMLLGRAWDSRLDIRWPAPGGADAGLRAWPEEEAGPVVVGVASRCGVEEDCCVVGEALRLEFLLLMAEKSMRSSLLDSSGSSLGARKDEDRPRTPDERMWRRSCLRL